MQLSKIARVVPLAAALSAAGGFGLMGAATAGAAGAHATMTTTKTGKITKFESTSAFSISVGKTTYVVHTNAMTHVTIGSKAAKVSALKKGETISVKGSLEMDTITATSIVEQM